MKNSSPLYQAYITTAIWNRNVKVYHYTRSLWVLHGPKHHKIEFIETYVYKTALVINLVYISS